MNHSQAERSDILNKLSYEKSIELLPVIIYVSVMMVTGLFGNILTCAFYGKKSQTTPTTRLMVAVAVTDAVICALMPKNIIVLCLSYRGYETILCRINVFMNHIFAITSGMLLVFISAFRFRAVCKAFASQFSVRHANMAITVSVVFAFVVSTPIIFTHETIPVSFTLSGNLTISGYDCNATPNKALKYVNLAVTTLHFFIFVAATITFIVLYTIIGSKIIKYYRVRRRLFGDTPSHTFTSVVSKSNHETVHTLDKNADPRAVTRILSFKINTEGECDINTAGSSSNNGTARFDSNGKMIKESAKHLSANSINSADNEQITTMTSADTIGVKMTGNDSEESVMLKTICDESKLTKDNEKVDKATSKSYAVAIRQALMLLIITAIFVLSFLPYLTMSIIRTMSGEENPNTDFTILVKFCQNSYLLNSATNPFVYGFFNLDFRRFVQRIICRPCSVCCGKNHIK